jgi:hypothetical protein
MAFILTDSLDFFTDYTITIAGTATDMAGFPLDGNQDGVGGDDWSVSFRTIARDVLALGETDIEAPSEFALRPNYPNPFNPSTNIPFTLPKNADVSVRVFDLQGQEVEQIIQASMSAGHYVTQWDASNVSSGLYLVKMDANEFSITRKITVLK